MAREIKYGMVGGSIYAFIGEVHRKALAFDTRAELVAGCFSNVESENIDTAKAYGVSAERTYKDYKEMAAAEAKRADKLDFVSICTPNFLHYEVAKEFLLAGINVVCEKPLCFAVEEAEELERLAKEKDLIFAVTYAYTGYVMPKVMKEMIAEGKIGTIAAIVAEYAQDWLIDELSPEKQGQTKNLSVWRTDPKFSGISNCVGDIGTHAENMIHYLTGLRMKRLMATTDNYGHALDLNANIIMEYEGGVRGQLWCSQIATGRMNGLVVRIYGSEGSLEWEQHFPDYVKFTPRGKATEILSKRNSYITERAHAAARIPSGHPEGYYVAFANTYRNILNAIAKKKAGEKLTADDLDFPKVSDGVNGVKFVHAVIESSKKDGAWVSLD